MRCTRGTDRVNVRYRVRSRRERTHGNVMSVGWEASALLAGLLVVVERFGQETEGRSGYGARHCEVVQRGEGVRVHLS